MPLKKKKKQLGCLVAQTVKNLPAMRETWVQSLGWEDALEEGMATHSSMLAWKIPTDRGARWAAVHGVSESDTTDGLTRPPAHLTDSRIGSTHRLCAQGKQKSNGICFVVLFTLLWRSGSCSISKACLRSHSFKAGSSPNPALSQQAASSRSSVSSHSP